MLYKDFFNFGQELSHRLWGYPFGHRLMFIRLTKGMPVPITIFPIASVQPSRCTNQSKTQPATSLAKKYLHK